MYQRAKVMDMCLEGPVYFLKTMWLKVKDLVVALPFQNMTTTISKSPILRLSNLVPGSRGGFVTRTDEDLQIG